MRLLPPGLAVLVYILMSTLVSAQTLRPEVIWAMPTSARIKCVTTVPGRMQVEYGTTSALGMTSPPEWRDWPDRDVTRHYVNLLDLQPNTTYYYRVRITPAGGGGDLVSNILTFKTFRQFSKLLPSVLYSSYIIGSDWTAGDTSAPYHDWNAQHYDLDIAYAYQNAPLVKAANPDAVLIRYDNISNSYVGAWREQNAHWMLWCDQQNIGYEHIAMHYAVDTEVDISAIGDTKFESIMLMLLVSGSWKSERFDYYNYKFPNATGEFIIIGQSLRFDAIYFTFATFASGGYDGMWEYCNQVDATGKPTGWAPLTVVEDTTVVNGQKFAQNGYVRFVPPKERTEWKRSRLYYNAGDRDEYYHPLAWRRVFYVRFRVTQSGTAPTCSNMNGIQHEDFSKPGPVSGKPVIPGWDSSWETNPANNADPEYNPNPPSGGGPGVAKSARFKWWSRAWYYKPDILRFLTNVFDPYYVQWISGPWLEYIRDTNPGIEGWYCDNYTLRTSPGRPISPTTTRFLEMETYDAYEYTKGMGEAMEKISTKLTQMNMVSCANDLVAITQGDDWSRPNITTQPDLLWIYFAPAIANREITMQYAQSYLGGNTSSLNTFFAEMAYRAYARGQYHVPMYAYTTATRAETNTQEWWDREKMRALAQYLLVRDPQKEYLFLNAWHQNFVYGEFLTDPSSSLHRYYVAGIPKQKAYYIDAAMLDFGQPVTEVAPSYSQWVAYPTSWKPGVIPGLFVIYYTDKAPVYDSNGNYLGDRGKTWYFARRYTKALVLLRTGESTVPMDERGVNAYTELALDGYYYRVRSDGSVDPIPINRINLWKHEGAVLIPTSDAPPSSPNLQVTVRVDKPNPKPLDVVTVTIEARNTGDQEARNISVRAPLASNTTFVRGSLNLNGSTLPDPPPASPWIEVTIPTIPAEHTAVIRFQFVVKPRE